MIVGYARVSTPDQCLDLQREALLEASCETIFEDKVSGKAATRPGLERTLDCLRSGDTLVVWKLDRLGRSMNHLVDLICKLSDKKVHFRSLTDSIDTSTASGRFFFHIMASMSEMERELASERTRAGLEAARKKGRVGGRRPKMTESKLQSARRLLSAGTPPVDVARDLGVSVPTLYRWLPASARP